MYRHVYGRVKKRRHIAIIGLSPAALAIEKQLMAIHRTNDINIEIYDDRTDQRFGYLARSPYRGRVAALLEKANNNEIDEVYITLPMIAKARIIDYITELSDTTVDTFVVPDLYSYNLSSSQFKSVGNVQILSVFATPFDGVGAVIKRLEDIVLSILILLLITPLLLAIAIGVKRSSPGPILFKQDRYG